ncbi:hypothetical protein GQ42DRAFT_114253, partial [Ramicandelaber brevisporus]
DPQADFLARERALLGDDVDLIATSFDIPETSPAPAASAAQPAPAVSSPVQPTYAAAATAAATATSPVRVAPAATPSYGSSSFIGGGGIESEFVREWREKQQQVIADRDARSQAKNEATLRTARDQLDNFYVDYNAKREKAIEQNRAKETYEVQQASVGNVWERILRQIDIVSATTSQTVKSPTPSVSSVKGGSAASKQKSPTPAPSAVSGPSRDLTRMRELLGELKRDPKAPGL